MPRCDLRPILETATRDHFIVGSFNVFNLETARAVLAAAERTDAPVVLAVAESQLRFTDFEALSRALVNLAERARVPVVIHLDHAQTLDVVTNAIRYGFTSVMFDGYGLDPAEKARQTRSVVDLAHSVGICVEAELGHITKSGVDAAKRDELLVDPTSAADFVRETGVDTIAAAVGTVHGLAPGEAQVDFERLEAIREAVPCFISMHGGSGLKPADLLRAADLGITKISYFTGLSKAAVKAVSERTATEPEPRLTELLAVAQSAIEERVSERITAFGSAGKASAAGA